MSIKKFTPPTNVREESVKLKVGQNFFQLYDVDVLGDIDFTVAVKEDGPSLFETDYLLWAEAKQGFKHDITESFIQLILTIGKARTFEKYLPPKFLGAFDQEKIAFIEFCEIMDVFFQNDFNWNVTPSDHSSKEFIQLKDLLSDKVSKKIIKFYFTDEKALKAFIKKNFRVDNGKVKQLPVTINNFTHIYQKWCKEVRDTIAIDWGEAQKAGLIDADFFLADLLSKDNATLKEKLYVLLRGNTYQFDRKVNFMGIHTTSSVDFNDNQKGHTQFWNRYKRPPRKAFWDKMVERRDLLVPQDVRERKGSFFTPPQWVELSQEYLAKELGENWQEEYYVWDCCAGTGNLLAGLTNKYHIYASTLDKADVDVMKDRIHTMEHASRGEHGGSNLLESHVFQFDFLNDPFSLDNPNESKLPKSLIEILKDEEKRRKLVIYINPPYAEAGNRKVIAAGGGMQKTSVAVKHLTYVKYLDKIGIAGRELFAQFIIRIFDEVPSCIIAQFSKLKIVQAPNFKKFRQTFKANLGGSFIVPADTFDNVSGKFPIGFFIWHLDGKADIFTSTKTDVYNKKVEYIGTKTLAPFDEHKSINDWIIETRNQPGELKIGYMSCRSHDFSSVNYNFIMNDKSQMKSPRGSWVTNFNLQECAIYIAVCHCIEPTWINDRDQFLYPNNKWREDDEFQSDCLCYTLFNNNIQANKGINYWIPFTEIEVGANEAFRSHFMSDYLKGKNHNVIASEGNLFSKIDKREGNVVKFSEEAQQVMIVAKELWRYYHQQPFAIADAGLYDIRLCFQKLNEKGKMNANSSDVKYMELISALRNNLKLLAQKIEPKVYEYGFLIK